MSSHSYISAIYAYEFILSRKTVPRDLTEEPLIIVGPRELAVRGYCKWLESRTAEESYKVDFSKTCQVTLESHLYPELILEDPGSGFFVQ
jgi:hypothetical protein